MVLDWCYWCRWLVCPVTFRALLMTRVLFLVSSELDLPVAERWGETCGRECSVFVQKTIHYCWDEWCTYLLCACIIELWLQIGGVPKTLLLAHLMIYAIGLSLYLSSAIANRILVSGAGWRSCVIESSLTIHSSMEHLPWREVARSPLAILNQDKSTKSLIQ